MTREEAATWIKEHVMWGEYNKGEYKEALDMAIKALEQDPTTKSCELCEYYNSHHEVCNYCYKCSLWTAPQERSGEE